MCRSTDFHGLYRDRLKVKSFFIRLTNLYAKEKLPESITLVYLPRINQTELQISGKAIRPDTPAFVSLHRVVTAKTEDGEVIYGSREPVVVTEAVSFEVYFREDKVLKGIFRKNYEEEEWKLECKCMLEREIGDVARAEVCVGLDGHVAMVERVELVAKMNRRNRRRAFDNFELEEIPEEREVDFQCESDGCYCCSFGDVENGLDGEDEEEIDLEGVSWAVDVGIWVMCMGVGYLVSKASAKRL